MAALALLSACGGGGGGNGGSSPPPPPLQGTLSGTVVKGPVAGATIDAYAISGGAMGTKIASATTDAQGHFSLSMGSYAGSVMLQMAGGTFMDEASGTTMTMGTGDGMSALVTGMTAGANLSGVEVTPLTTMAQQVAQHMAGGMTDANIGTANTAVDHYFMVADIVHDAPMDPLATGSGNAASQDAINYGMVLAGMSRLAHDAGMSTASAMVTAMASDAMDGVMDGQMSGSAVMMGGMNMSMPLPASTGTTGLATAMAAFAASPQNHSGVAAATLQSLMNQLNGSDGHMMGGSGSTSPGTMMSGKVFNGSVSHATVTAYAITGGAKGPMLATSPTDAQGAFSLSLGNYSGTVMLQATMGTYLDEATGASTTMRTDDQMTLAMANVAAGSNMSGVWIDPLTSMGQMHAQNMSGGMTDANVQSANSAVGSYFMVDDVVHATPMNPATPGSGSGASASERNCGIAIAAMAQYAKSANMMSSAFVTAMMQDASDGMMDGKMGGSSITMGGMMGSGSMMMQSTAGTTGLASAMTDFMSSAMNHSGLTAADMNPLIQKLASSSGQL